MEYSKGSGAGMLCDEVETVKEFAYTFADDLQISAPLTKTTATPLYAIIHW